MEIQTEHFDLLRSSNPAAAFTILVDTIRNVMKDDPSVARELTSALRNFKSDHAVRDGAHRLGLLKAQGADKLGINVGSLPLLLSAGVVFIYDAAVERMRSSDEGVDPEMINARTLRTVERVHGLDFPNIGSMGATALERALADKHYAQRLRDRAAELKWAEMDSGGIGCDYCMINVRDKATGEVISSYCGSKEECDTLGTLFLAIILIYAIYKVIKWLF